MENDRPVEELAEPALRQDATCVAAALDEIATLLALSSDGRFKAEAYARGARVVAALDQALGPRLAAGTLTAIEGIGPSLARQIGELAQTGRSSLLERLRAEYPPGAAELASLPGMTLRRMRALHEALGIDSRITLRAACEAQRVRGVSGFGAKTEAKLLAALEFEPAPAPAQHGRMLLARALGLAARIARALTAQGIASVELAGAARRGEELVDELELAVLGSPERVRAAVHSLLVDADSDGLLLLLDEHAAREAGLADDLAVQAPENEEDAALADGLAVHAEEAAQDAALADGLAVRAVGGAKRALAAPLTLRGRVVDSADGHRASLPLVLHLSEATTRGARLLHATGPALHLQALRAHAARRALTLTPAALRRADGSVHGASADERALYEQLGLPYLPPELRHFPLDPARPLDLVAIEHIRGLVHCHTTHSDGRASIEEMARAAEALGMQYITITDHSPSAHYARGVALDRLKQQWDEIAEAQQRVAIRILRGTESDILGDGALDYPDAVLEQFDVVIASIHARLRMDRAQMTERLVRAMKQPFFKIWGHALGRLLLKRDPIDCDVEQVLDALASSRGAIELNGDPHRLDLPPEWVPAARARGIPFVLSVDAHSTAGLDSLSFAVTMARRGGVQRSEVLNTLPSDEFMRRVKP